MSSCFCPRVAGSAHRSRPARCGQATATLHCVPFPCLQHEHTNRHATSATGNNWSALHSILHDRKSPKRVHRVTKIDPSMPFPVLRQTWYAWRLEQRHLHPSPRSSRSSTLRLEPRQPDSSTAIFKRTMHPCKHWLSRIQPITMPRPTTTAHAPWPYAARTLSSQSLPLSVG
jgi:hypothetical protein